jgi:polyisoprenoid-binding protein YceI
MKKTLVAMPLAALIAVAVGIGVWWFAIRSDASPLDDPLPIPTSLLNTATPTPAATEPGATAGPTAAATEGQVWAIIADDSEADYYVGETLASIGVPSTANGKTTDITGTFYLNSTGDALDTSQTSSFTVDLTTLASNEDRRDNRVQDALETGQFPAATFTAESVSGLTTPIADGETVEFQLTGTLDLHGVQRQVIWDVEATRQQNVISAIATLDFNFSDYDISPPNIGGFVSVQDHGQLQAVIFAQQQS